MKKGDRRGPSRDLSGKIFSRLTVVSLGRRCDRSGAYYWKCKCECGVITDVRSDQLWSGGSKSCGCLQIEASTTHGLFRAGPGASKNPAYKSWMAMIMRCLFPEAKGYSVYGGAGVKIDPKWMIFENFLVDMGPRPSTTHTIDRFPDQKGDYAPGNCRWATPKQQARNKSNTTIVVYMGRSWPLSELTEHLGVRYALVAKRVRAGWDIHRAVTDRSRKWKMLQK